MALPAAEVERRKPIMIRNANTFSKRVPLELEKAQRGLLREVQRRLYADDDLKALELLYNYVDRVMSHAQGVVACKRGCSSCCRNEIALWQVEADMISAKTGLAVNKISVDPARRTTPYTGTKTPCPFLDEEACTIYAYRPLACRTMVNFDADSTICQFEHRDDTQTVQMNPGQTFSGVYEALSVILRRHGGGAGDIREFFGSGAAPAILSNASR